MRTLTGRVRLPDSLRAGGRAWGIGGVILAVVIGIVSLLPPRGTPGVEIADLGEILATLGHAAAYAVLGAVAIMAQKQRRPGLTVVALIGYGVLLEVLQGAVGLRSFQASDIAANALGALVGVGAVTLLLRPRE